MRLRPATSSLAGLGFGAASWVLFAASPFGAGCEDEHRRSNPGQTPTGGGACEAAPGEFARPDCDPSSGDCSGGGCSIDVARCGPVDTCQPLTQPDAKNMGLRLRRLNVIAPGPLSFTQNRLVQLQIINKAVELDAPACGEQGDGTFNFLLRLDREARRLTLGGAPPPTDPLGQGFCFLRDRVGNFDITPVDVAFSETANTFTSDVIPKLLVPIFIKGGGTLVLPLTSAVLRDVTLSDSGRCVGSFNGQALDTSCTEVYADCQKWRTAGSLGGIITLVEADDVFIQELNASLCTLLTGKTDPQTKRCPRNGALIDAEGDYCSNPEGPGGCRDSVWLAATFAASAVAVHDGTSEPRCQGAPSRADAGGLDATNDGGPTDGATSDARD